MRYVLIGTGNIANTYINALNNIDGCECVGFVSRSANPKYSPHWPDLTSVDRPFDCVIVATPNGLHHEGIVAAANLGKHVICEKPIATTCEHAEQAIAACERAGTTLAVAFQRRHAVDNLAVKRLLEKNAFGRIYAADLSAKFYRPQSYYDSSEYRGGWAVDGGGVFMQQACHNLDIYTWFFGVPETIVSMLSTYDHEMEAEDHGVAIIRTESGMLGSITASTAAKPGFAARLEVHTAKGAFTLTDDNISLWEINGVEQPNNGHSSYRHSGATSAVVSDTSAHELVIKDFQAAIIEGRKPLADANSALQTTRFIQNIYGANLFSNR